MVPYLEKWREALRSGEDVRHVLQEVMTQLRESPVSTLWIDTYQLDSYVKRSVRWASTQLTAEHNLLVRQVRSKLKELRTTSKDKYVAGFTPEVQFPDLIPPFATGRSKSPSETPQAVEASRPSRNLESNAAKVNHSATAQGESETPQDCDKEKESPSKSSSPPMGSGPKTTAKTAASEVTPESNHKKGKATETLPETVWNKSVEHQLPETTTAASPAETAAADPMTGSGNGLRDEEKMRNAQPETITSVTPAETVAADPLNGSGIDLEMPAVYDDEELRNTQPETTTNVPPAETAAADPLDGSGNGLEMYDDEELLNTQPATAMTASPAETAVADPLTGSGNDLDMCDDEELRNTQPETTTKVTFAETAEADPLNGSGNDLEMPRDGSNKRSQPKPPPPINPSTQHETTNLRPETGNPLAASGSVLEMSAARSNEKLQQKSPPPMVSNQQHETNVSSASLNPLTTTDVVPSSNGTGSTPGSREGAPIAILARTPTSAAAATATADASMAFTSSEKRNPSTASEVAQSSLVSDGTPGSTKEAPITVLAGTPPTATPIASPTMAFKQENEEEDIPPHQILATWFRETAPDLSRRQRTKYVDGLVQLGFETVGLLKRCLNPQHWKKLKDSDGNTIDVPDIHRDYLNETMKEAGLKHFQA